jgi:DNA-binding NarL/FixJ family response regulator
LTEPRRPVRVVLADDHALFREGLHQLLIVDGLIDVVAEGENGAEAVHLAVQYRPDVVLLDLEMPGQEVTTTLRQLHEQVPEAKAIVLTMHDEPTRVQQSLAAGASAYLVKTVARRELVAAICASADSGESDFVTVSVPRQTLKALDSADPTPLLSAREVEVLTLVGRAASNAQVAAKLFISEGTVKRHLSNIYTKLGAVSRIDAVRRAVQAGLLPDLGANDESEAQG